MSHFPPKRKKEKEKTKQTNKPEYKKPHKNTMKTKIKTDQQYKGGALTKLPNLPGR